MARFLSAKRVLLKDYKSFAQKISQTVKQHAINFADKANRPYLYLESNDIEKEDLARQIMVSDNINTGLVCILACLEVCRTITVKKCYWSKNLLKLGHFQNGKGIPLNLE